MRLIDADALHKMLEEAHDGTRRIYSSLVDYRDKEVCKGELGTYAIVKRMVEEAPTIDPESLRPKGRWVDRYEGKYANPLYVCSECREYALLKTEYDMLFREGIVQVLSDFCPNCSADMREDKT